LLQYKITGSLLEPRSNPTHYTDLVKELEEAPNRTFFGRIAKRLGGMIRFN
jgi:cytochrome b pre-mRNA-processing protein 6